MKHALATFTALAYVLARPRAPVSGPRSPCPVLRRSCRTTSQRRGDPAGVFQRVPVPTLRVGGLSAGHQDVQLGLRRGGGGGHGGFGGGGARVGRAHLALRGPAPAGDAQARGLAPGGTLPMLIFYCLLFDKSMNNIS